MFTLGVKRLDLIPSHGFDSRERSNSNSSYTQHELEGIRRDEEEAFEWLEQQKKEEKEAENDDENDDEKNESDSTHIKTNKKIEEITKKKITDEDKIKNKSDGNNDRKSDDNDDEKLSAKKTEYEAKRSIRIFSLLRRKFYGGFVLGTRVRRAEGKF